MTHFATKSEVAAVTRALKEIAERLRLVEVLPRNAVTTVGGAGDVTEGPGIDIPPGTAQIGVGEDSILLIDNAQQPAFEYPWGLTGLSQALSAAGVDDQVRIQGVGTIGGAQSIKAGVELRGLGRNTVLSGTISNAGTIGDVDITGGLTNTGYTHGVSINGDSYIGGGYQNDIKQGGASLAPDFSTVSGGRDNNIYDSDYATVGGGRVNDIGHLTLSRSSDYGTIAGGWGNYLSSAVRSAICGGESNQCTSDWAASQGNHQFIGGGSINHSSEGYTVICGGFTNDNFGRYGFIGGGRSNTINPTAAADQGFSATISGGSDNTIYNSGDYSFIGGGEQNFVSGDICVVVGGGSNDIGDGVSNHPTYCAIVGGRQNLILPGGAAVVVNYSFVGGGNQNHIYDSDYAVIVGGFFNEIGDSVSSAASDYSFVGGGRANIIEGSQYGSILGGFEAFVDKYGQEAYAAGAFVTAGDAQRNGLIARRTVTHSDANWYELYLDGATASLATIPADTVWGFEVRIVGTTQGSTKSFDFEVKGTIENDGGTTSILASTVTTIYDADDVSFDARVTADDAGDALLVEVQDADGASDIVRWVATIRFPNVTFPA